MKKKLIFGLAFTLLTLSACGKEEVTEVTCDPIVKEVEKTVEKEVIKEVEVPTEVIVNKDYDAEKERLYTPGTYFKSLEKNSKGEVIYAIVSVDDYGRLAGVHISKTTSVSDYKYDNETHELFVRVDGLEDVIPNSYRLVTPGVTKSLEDAFTPNDLIEGFPLHDARIASLVDLKASETQAIVDYNSENFDGSYTDQMEKLAKKILEDQGTYGINFYDAGDSKLTTNISGVTIDCLEEINLVQNILDTDARYTNDTIIIPVKEAPKGLYKPGTYYSDTVGLVNNNEVFFNTSLVVVDEFGNLVTVFLDETNALSTKKLEDKEWSSEVNKVETSILNNKSCNGFKYLNEKKEEVDFNNKLVDGKYSDLITLGNVDTNLKVNGLLSPVIDTLTNTNEAKLALVPGNYYMADEDGNMMSVSIRNVVNGYKRIDNTKYNTASDASTKVYGKALEAGNYTLENVKKAFPIGMILENADKSFFDSINPSRVDVDKYAYIPTYEAVIVAMSLDSLYKADQASFEFEGVKYPLYTYEMSYLTLSNEQEVRETYIFKNNDEYFYAENFTLDGEEYEVEDKVKFNTELTNEVDTVKAVEANLTKQTLKDELGMKTRVDQLEWYEQANAYTNYFIGKNSAYIFNMIDDKHTDSISGVTIDINKYNNLLVLLLTSASDIRNISDNVVNFDNQLGLSEFVAGNKSLNGGNTYKNASFTDGYRLADGTYYSYSKLPNSDGEYALVTFTVYNNQLINVMFDETTLVGTALNTKANLGYDYRVNTKFEKQDNEKDLSYANRIKDLTGLVNVSMSVSDLVDGYDYELESTLKEDKDFFSDQDAYVYKFNDAFESGLLAALRSRVAETMEEVVTTLDNALGKDKYVVASDDKDGALSVDLADSLKIATINPTTKYEVEVEIEEQDKVLDLDETNNEWTFNADVDDVNSTLDTKYTVSVEYDDYDILTKENSLKLMSNQDYKKLVMESSNDTLNLKSNKLRSGETIKLALAGKDLLDTTRLGDGSDINPLVHFKVKNVENTNLTFNAFGQIFRYDGHDFFVKALGTDEFTLTGTGSAVVKLISKEAGFVKLSDLLSVKYDKDGAGTLEEVTSDEAIELLVSDLHKALNTTNNMITLEVIDPEKTSKVNIKAFFDIYEDEDERVGIWQRGEVSKDFEFEVMTAKAVNKYAKENIKIKGVSDYLTDDTNPYMLTTASDLGISGINKVNYSAKIKLDNVEYPLETAQILKDKTGKEYKVFELSDTYAIVGTMPNRFTKVTIKNGMISEFSTENNIKDSVTRIGGIVVSNINEAYALATDGFNFLKDNEGNITSLNVKVDSLKSNRLNIEAKLNDEEVLKEMEVIITKASPKKLLDRVEEAIDKALVNLYPVLTYSDLVNVEDKNNDVFKRTLVNTLSLSDEFDVNDIEVKYYYENGKEIKLDNAPTLGSVLLGQIELPEKEEDVKSSIKVVVSYEMDDKDLTYETKLETVIYNNLAK